ncbi:MAG: aldo/keto reductase [Chloroflexi bacterium]|nr:aldo/keto reductase [Chloroflexota bacterium]
MKYRTLGRTGIRISEVGFGCGNVGGLMVRGAHQEQVQAMRRALELGINYFDTAPSYGNGQSETNLGKALAAVQPQATIGTKVGIRPGDMGDLKGTVERSLAASLERLGRTSVDILYLHTGIGIERGWDGRDTLSLSDVLGAGGVADVFEDLRSRGLVRFLGFTANGETQALHRLVDSGRFDLFQMYYNLLNPSAGVQVPQGFPAHDFQRLIDRAQGANMGVVVIRVLAGGALGGAEARNGYAAPTIGGAMVPGGEYGADEERAGALGFIIAEGSAPSLPQAAVRFALMHPGVSTVLVGYSSMGQLEEAAAAAAAGPLPGQVLERLQGVWAADFGRVASPGKIDGG